MFTILFEAREKVMLTRYSGVFSSEDISSLDEFVAGFIAREGIYVRNIFDFTAVEAVAIPRPRLLERGRKPRTNPGQDRVVVAPQHEIYELFRDYAQAHPFSVGIRTHNFDTWPRASGCGTHSPRCSGPPPAQRLHHPWK
jgi:hypothetical protein